MLNFAHVYFSGPAILTSPIQLTPGKWHTVSIKRRMKEGHLKLDDHPEVTGKSEGNTRGLNIRNPIYFGSINSKQLQNNVEIANCECAFQEANFQLLLEQE